MIFDVKDLFGLSVVTSKLGVTFTKCPFTCICVVFAFQLVFILNIYGSRKEIIGPSQNGRFLVTMDGLGSK